MKRRRELSYAKKRADTETHYNHGTRPLTPLSVGDSVSVQNRRGPRPLRWDRTGVVIERLEHRQYLVKFDGSGMVLRRTRGHLRKIDPATRNRRIPDAPEQPLSDPQLEEPLHIPGQLSDGTHVIDPVAPTDETPAEEVVEEALPLPSHEDNSGTAVPHNCDAPVPDVSTRRSTRCRKPVMRLSPTMRGKHHGTSTAKL